MRRKEIRAGEPLLRSVENRDLFDSAFVSLGSGCKVLVIYIIA